MIKRIETLEDKEKKDKRNKTIIGVILVGLMMFSVAGYAFFGSDTEKAEKVKFGDLTFYKQAEFWKTDIAGRSFYFHYLPNETIKSSITKTLNDYGGKSVYFTKSGEAEQEIMANIQAFTKISFACLDENCTENWPIKNCTSNLIIIEESNKDVITQQENCVFISANDTLKGADTFLYRILGIK